MHYAISYFMFRDLKRNSYLIVALLVFTIIFCKIIGSCRYSEFHQIYKVGVLKAKNFIFILLSLSPIFFWLITSHL